MALDGKAEDKKRNDRDHGEADLHMWVRNFVGDLHRDRHIAPRRQRQRNGALALIENEDKQDGCRQAAAHHRKRHAEVCAPTRHAVHHRRFLNFPRRLVDEAFQHLGGERHVIGDVNECEKNRCEGGADGGADNRERHGYGDRRHHAERESLQRHEISADPVAQNGKGRKQVDQHGKERRGNGNDGRRNNGAL